MTTTNKHLLNLADRIISEGAPTWSFEVRYDVIEALTQAAGTALKADNIGEARKLIDAAALVVPRMALAA